MTRLLGILLMLLFSLSGPAMVENGDFGRSSLAAETTESLMQSGAGYVLPTDRAAVNAFNKSALADFRASGGQIVNLKEPQAFFGRYNPTENIIQLAPGRHLDTLTEELIHFRQAQELKIVNKAGFPGGPESFEADAKDRLLELGFTPFH